MQHKQHGGRCCGIAHLWDFDEGLTEDEKPHFVRCVEEADDYGTTLEVVLIDQQLDDSGIDEEWDDIDPEDMQRLRDALVEYDFILVSRFKNGNSGNWVNIFIRPPEFVSTTECKAWEGRRMLREKAK